MSIQAFIERCDAYCRKAGRTRVWLSKKLFAQTRKLDDLANGDVDIGVRRMELATADLAALEQAAADEAISAEAVGS